ncbi:MAG: helix-turn-helix transcriptional regulator, partial [Desulfobacterales bacterium]|nr:helix-turn-helix transcriptional regulator [Desulfobacterales bacterium]
INIFRSTYGNLFRLIFDSLSAHVAIIDKNGWILETNASWKKFADSNNLKMRPETIDINYLDACSGALDTESGDADYVYRGINDLINKKKDEFILEYPCHSPETKRWFYMRATRLEIKKQLYIVISHENITPLKEAQENLMEKERALKKRQEEMEIQSAHLAEANTALKVLLNQRESDKEELEKQIIRHIGELVLPHLDQLMDSGLTSRQTALTQTVKVNLENITAPFLNRISTVEMGLTPLEIRVANLIREGRQTKEIAMVLSSSVDAVNFHRKNIRKKLGLTGKKINLRTFLLSLK